MQMQGHHQDEDEDGDELSQSDFLGSNQDEEDDGDNGYGD